MWSACCSKFGIILQISSFRLFESNREHTMGNLTINFVVLCLYSISLAIGREHNKTMRSVKTPILKNVTNIVKPTSVSAPAKSCSLEAPYANNNYSEDLLLLILSFAKPKILYPNEPASDIVRFKCQSGQVVTNAKTKYFPFHPIISFLDHSVAAPPVSSSTSSMTRR